MRLDGLAIAITGAAGGVGAACARDLVARGAQVALIDVPSTRLDELARELDSLALPCDVADESAVAAVMGALDLEWGRLSGLIVTAGIQLHGEDGPVAEVSIEVWNRTIAVNLTGAFLCVKHAVPLLVREAQSSVLLVGSPTGLTMAGAGYAAYSASKAGMMALGRTTAADYASHGLRANVVVPGTIETPLVDALLIDPVKRRSLLAGTPIGRLGQPSDLTGLIAWLISPESGFATGGFFAVDGGLTAR